jgi:hypothetical protein
MVGVGSHTFFATSKMPPRGSFHVISGFLLSQNLTHMLSTVVLDFMTSYDVMVLVLILRVPK